MNLFNSNLDWSWIVGVGRYGWLGRLAGFVVGMVLLLDSIFCEDADFIDFIVFFFFP
jgi:hypothetical protein